MASAAEKIQIVNAAGDQAARVISGELQTSPGSDQDTTSRASKVQIVDPVTGESADVVLGALVVAG